MATKIISNVNMADSDNENVAYRTTSLSQLQRDRFRGSMWRMQGSQKDFRKETISSEVTGNGEAAVYHYTTPPEQQQSIITNAVF